MKLTPSIVAVACLLGALSANATSHEQSAIAKLDPTEAHALIEAGEGLVFLDIYAEW